MTLKRLAEIQALVDPAQRHTHPWAWGWDLDLDQPKRTNLGEAIHDLLQHLDGVPQPVIAGNQLVAGARIMQAAVIRMLTVAADVPREGNLIAAHMDLVVRCVGHIDPERVIQNARGEQP